MIQVDDEFLAHGCTPPWFLHCHTPSLDQASTPNSLAKSTSKQHGTIRESLVTPNKLKIVHLEDSLPQTNGNVNNSPKKMFSYLSIPHSTPQSPVSSSPTRQPQKQAQLGAPYILHTKVPSSANILQAPDPLSLGIGLHHYGLVDWSSRGIDTSRFPICQTPSPLSICPNPILHLELLNGLPLAMACPTCWSGQRRGGHQNLKHNPYAAYYRMLRRQVKGNPQHSRPLTKLMDRYSKLWRRSIKVNRSQFNEVLQGLDKELDAEDKQQKLMEHKKRCKEKKDRQISVQEKGDTKDRGRSNNSGNIESPQGANTEENKVKTLPNMDIIEIKPEPSNSKLLSQSQAKIPKVEAMKQLSKKIMWRKVTFKEVQDMLKGQL